MRIGEAADAAGVPTQTIRFYERRGLLPPPRRGSNGYREYDSSILTRIAFIRSGQAAGLTLVEWPASSTFATAAPSRAPTSTPCS